MFNEEYKMEFINSETQNEEYKKLLITYYEMVEMLEIKLGKDLSNFSAREIEAYYKSLFSKSLERLDIINNSFLKYTQFMIGKGLVNDRINHYQELNTQLLLSFLATTDDDIISRKELLKLINTLQNDCHKFLILGLFEGIYGTYYSEFYELTMDNFNGNTLNLPNRKLKISNELLALAESSSEEYTYIKNISAGSGVRSSVRYFDSADKRILKDKIGIINPSKKGRRLQSELDVCRRFLGCEAITNKGLRESGRIEMINTLHKKEPDKDIKQLILDNRNVIEDRYGNFSNNSINNFILKYEKYLE